MMKHVPTSRSELFSMAPIAAAVITEDKNILTIARETSRAEWSDSTTVYYECFHAWGGIRNNFTLLPSGDWKFNRSPESEGILVVSDSEYAQEVERRMLPVWAEYNQRRLARAAEIEQAEAEHIPALQAKYPAFDPNAPHPSIAEAIERGVAWCPRHSGCEEFFIKEDNGAWSCNTFGAMYIGCFGVIPDVLPDYRDPKQFEAFLQAISYAVSDLRDVAGRLRQIKVVGAMVSNAVADRGHYKGRGWVEYVEEADKKYSRLYIADVLREKIL